MTDIAERLRRPGNFEEGPFLMAEAAAEIERLRKMLSTSVPGEFHRSEVERLQNIIDRQPVQQPNDTVFPGFRGNNEA